MKDNELKNLLSQVEAELGDMFKSERLSKAVEGEETPDEGSAGPESPSASPPPPEAEGSAAGPGPDAAPGEAAGEAGPDAGAPGGDPAGDGGNDVEQLKQEYLALGQQDPEALKAHYLACVAAIQAVAGGGQGGPEGSAGGPPGAAPGPEGSAPPPGAAMKAELGSVAPKGGLGGGKDRLAAVATKKGELGPANGDVVNKSEKDLKIEELNKSLETLVGAFSKFLGAPERKALVSIAGLNKSETKELTKAEAKVVLMEKISNGTLKKSTDKERVTAFCVGNIGLSDIQDLLR